VKSLFIRSFFARVRARERFRFVWWRGERGYLSFVRFVPGLGWEVLVDDESLAARKFYGRDDRSTRPLTPAHGVPIL
jgi:hypothetical protein